MINILLCLFLFACATTPGKLPSSAVLSVRTFSSPTEARNFIRNKHLYLRMLFEQSRDPYYGTPKWPEECLKENQSGTVNEKGGHTFFLARLLLDEKNQPGDCKGKSREVIYLHCKETAEALEIICPPGDCAEYFRRTPCPLRQ